MQKFLPHYEKYRKKYDKTFFSPHFSLHAPAAKGLVEKPYIL